MQIIKLKQSFETSNCLVTKLSDMIQEDWSTDVPSQTNKLIQLQLMYHIWIQERTYTSVYSYILDYIELFCYYLHHNLAIKVVSFPPPPHRTSELL